MHCTSIQLPYVLWLLHCFSLFCWLFLKVAKQAGEIHWSGGERMAAPSGAASSINVIFHVSLHKYNRIKRSNRISTTSRQYFYLPLKYRLLRCFILFDDVWEHFSMLISANLIEICIMYFHAHIILSQGICMYYM